MKFLYKGPPSGVTLRDGEHAREVMLHTGKEVDLPEEHEYTRTLLALAHLVPLALAPIKQAKGKGEANV